MALTAAVLAPVLLAGCGTVVTVAPVNSDLVACKESDDGTPANGVVLMAQSVPTASWVPCLKTMPLGWKFRDLDARSGAASFWLGPTHDPTHAIEVRLTESCSTDGATKVRSERADMTRLQVVSQVSPDFIGRRLYLFDGGCITVAFDLDGKISSEGLAVATQAFDAVPRDELRELVHEESDGRLQLDPPVAAGGGGP
jgi:hypothetical protein